MDLGVNTDFNEIERFKIVQNLWYLLLIFILNFLLLKIKKYMKVKFGPTN